MYCDVLGSTAVGRHICAFGNCSQLHPGVGVCGLFRCTTTLKASDTSKTYGACTLIVITFMVTFMAMPAPLSGVLPWTVRTVVRSILW